MTRIQTVACGVCLIFVELAPAAADTTADAPVSLRMRVRPSAAAHPSALPRGKRIAQPTPDQPPVGDPPPATATPAPPPPAPEPTPATDPSATPEAAPATAAPTSTAAQAEA